MEIFAIAVGLLIAVCLASAFEGQRSSDPVLHQLPNGHTFRKKTDGHEPTTLCQCRPTYIGCAMFQHHERA